MMNTWNTTLITKNNSVFVTKIQKNVLDLSKNEIMSTNTPIFIKVRRVLSKKDSSMNTKIEDETININDIQGYRPWHKGPNDKDIEGPMIQIVRVNNSKHKVILIQEEYYAFEARLAAQGVTIK